MMAQTLGPLGVAFSLSCGIILLILVDAGASPARVKTSSCPSLAPSQLLGKRTCGIVRTQQECENRGCCWSTSANADPLCYSHPADSCQPNAPRSDCGYVGITQSQCENKGCCWQATPNQPWCFYKTQDTPSYVVSSVSSTTLGTKLTLQANGSSSFGDNISPLTMEISQETSERLHVKIYDPNNQRWEVPTSVSPVPSPPSKPPSSTLYQYTHASEGQPFSFSLTRKANSEVVFNSTGEAGLGLQFADQFLQFTTTLPNNYNIYGLGEHVCPLRLESGRTYTLWTFDTATPEYLNLYGSHPFYLDMRTSGNAHGVFLRNSNGMDVVLGANSLTYRVIGGVLDLYLFLGPQPEAVVQQYQEVIGRPHLPSYWSLGFHLSQYGFPNIETLEQVVANFSANKIPLDTIWSDIDYMDQYKDFTLDPINYPSNKVKQFIENLHKNGMHYVVIVDPGIKTQSGYAPYDQGLAQDIFIKDKNNNVFTGKVWPGITAFPDFLNPKTNQYWQDQISTFHNNLAPVDGLWIDMNEISNFCSGECTSSSDPKELKKASLGQNRGYHHGSRQLRDARGGIAVGFDPNNPPYHIQNQGSGNTPLNTKTLDMDARLYGGVLEYDAHNIFGLTEAIATSKALENIRQNRSFVLSRSTFPGSGSHTAKWTGDNHSQDSDLYFSIPGMLNFQLFGVPQVGADICGFLGNSNEKLCGRWMEVGAFYPFSRNHNSKGNNPQEPYVWPSVAAISRKVLGIRYSILPFYYTLFYKANRPVDPSNAPSATVVRPLFFEFPRDQSTYSIDKQFMIGGVLLVSPVLDQSSTSVTAYFPGPAAWYDFYNGSLVSAKGSESITFSCPFDHIQLHIRGGSVVPMQDPGLTTTASRANNFSLMVALDASGEAKGDLYLDDGESITVKSYSFISYAVSSNKLTAQVSGTGYATPPLVRMTAYGVSGTPSKAYLNGQPISGFKFDSALSTLTLSSFSAPMDSEFTISWE